MRLRRAALPPIVLAVVLMGPGACGQGAGGDTSDFEGEEKRVAQAVYDIRDAVAQGDARELCDSYFTDALREQLGGPDCADRLETSIRDVTATEIDVTDVQLSGGTATVRITTDVRGEDDPQDELQLRNERGWRLSQLG